MVAVPPPASASVSVLLPSLSVSLLFFLLLLTTTTTSTSSSPLLLSDINTLLSLKNSFQSPHPSLLSTWQLHSSPAATAADVCSTWYGIHCNVDGDRVTSLDLTDLNLGGTVSLQNLSSLDALTHLSLAGNNFTATITNTPHLINLPNLQSLNISNNKFTGKLDTWNFTSSFPNLQSLDINNNNFTSLLPSTNIIKLKHTLRHLDLGGNYFYGEIPSIYGELTNLEYLFLGGNDLTGKIPSSLGNLTSLKELYLGHYNTWSGGIPPSLSNLINLHHLDLSNCNLDGTIPPQLGNLQSLNTLYIYQNQLTGTIPTSFGNLTNLLNLDLSFNTLTGEIPSQLSNLKKLNLFNLYHNKLHGSIPDYISELPELETLGLWSNNFTGVIPQGLGKKGRLQVVDLSSNKLTSGIPPHLCESKQLRILILFKNFLFGEIPDGLGECITLTRVRLGQNYLNGSIPLGFIYLPEMSLLELQDNYLSGNLTENQSSSSSSTSKLTQLNLSNNLISGTLPYSISNLTSLQILLLSNNKLTGEIPPSILPGFKQLTKIDLSGNSFYGPIPSTITECDHLNFIDMSRNNLSGPIPSEISTIRILNYLNISHNSLNGTIPVSIGSMHSLTNADFSYNNFTGEVMNSGQFSLLNSSSFIGNPFLCGINLKQQQQGCTTTSSDEANSVNGDNDEKKHGVSEFKLIFAVCLLICSLLFVSIAVVKAKAITAMKRNSSWGGTSNSSTMLSLSPGSWKMTVFGKVDFTMMDILDCVKDGNVIGRGGGGIVYYGKTETGMEFAVKKLVVVVGGGGGSNNNSSHHHHDHGFKAEVETLGNIRHRNIVRLLAFCTNKKGKGNLLVYEYMRNGSLGEGLHEKKGGFLGWNLRYKIAVEAAKGLCYLHHDCTPLIVHRDVKSNNILLDDGFEAHVADFGLAKFMMGGGGVTEECMSAIAGSYGYIAPEYAYTLRVDEKSDVYSYGVVLLELLTGKKPVGEFGDGVDIVHWSRQTTNCRREEVDRIIDQRISPVPLQEAMHVFFIAMLCVQENSVERPTMREVVHMLTELRTSLHDGNTNGVQHQQHQHQGLGLGIPTTSTFIHHHDLEKGAA